jgi:hypothetical protein
MSINQLSRPIADLWHLPGASKESLLHLPVRFALASMLLPSLAGAREG